MMKECEWDRIMKNDRSVCEADTRMARILKTDTEQTLLQAIKNDSIFGFAVCSVKTNPDDIDKMIKVSQMSLINFKRVSRAVLSFHQLFKRKKLNFPKPAKQ